MDKAMVAQVNQLESYLRKIDGVYPLSNLLQDVEAGPIEPYYQASDLLYKMVHSYHGSFHLALNYDGVFSRRGFHTQVNEIAGILRGSGAKSVLEVGCGKGFNTILLAEQLPDVRFYGIDLMAHHVKVAKRKSRHLRNVHVSQGDFHALTFPPASFDVVFDVEAVCHARDVRQVLSEIHRVLKAGGQFIAYNGFRRRGFEQLPGRLIQAAIVVERSFVVNAFQKIDAWLEMASATGFVIRREDDLSEAVKPNLAKLQLLARKYFEFPRLAKLFAKLFGYYTMLNCIAVLLLPFTMFNGAHGYYKIILEKRR